MARKRLLGRKRPTQSRAARFTLAAIKPALAALAAVSVPLITASPALAATAPKANIAYYVGADNQTTMYNDGCSQGKRDAGLNVSSLVILDFGGQQSVSGSPGVKFVSGTLVSDTEVQALAVAFAHGYYSCTGTDTSTVLKLAVGTNNSDQVSSSWGDTWAALAASTMSAVTTAGYSAQVTVYGANDIEPGFGSVSAATAWADAYSAHANRPLYQNYGAADGCPTSGAGSCNNGWTSSGIYHVSWGASAAEPFPEIYSNTLAKQWAAVSASQGTMTFIGSLSQYEACAQQNNPSSCNGLNIGPDTSWADLSGATGQNPSYSDDIGFSNLAYHS